MSAAERVRFTVEAGDCALRLDQLLAARIDGLSRRKARVLLDIGGVYVDGQRVKVAGRKLREGQVVEAVIGAALNRATGRVGAAARERDAAALPPIEVVFEDDDIIVIDKPVGVLAAPTPEGDRGNAADQLGRERDVRVHVVHRIDRPTSGLLVYAKTDAANRALSDTFRDHTGEREYLAIVAGAWDPALARIDAPIAGKSAVTHVAIRESLEDATALTVTLETGRTHQIRIHCADAGHPILGDRRYGQRHRANPGRLALHARVLGFPHPRTGQPMRFECAIPAPLAALLKVGP